VIQKLHIASMHSRLQPSEWADGTITHTHTHTHTHTRTHTHTHKGDSTRIKHFAARSHLLYCLPCEMLLYDI